MHKTLTGSRIAIYLLCLFFSLFETTAKAQIYSYTSTQTGVPASVNANATGSSLTRVNGASAPGSPCGSGFSSTSFSSATSYNSSLQAVNVDLTPNSTFQLNVTGISVGLRRSGTGPASARLAYSINNGANWIDQGFDVAPNNAGCGSVTNFTWTLPATVTLTTIFKFRVYLFNASGGSGTLQIMNLNINGTATSATTPPCTTPGDPTNFLYTIISPVQTNVSFTAPAGSPSGYLAIRSTNPVLSANPVNATSYNVNDVIGGGTVIYKGTATNFSSTGLDPMLDYYYFIFAYNNTACTGGPLYSGSLSGVDSLPAPVITQDPADSTACTGTAASFNVAATNGVSYQWQEFTGSWTNMSNAGVYSGVTTNTLAVSDVTGLDGHQYRCIVMGSLSHKDTSATANLFLRPNTNIVAQPVNAVTCENNDTSFHVRANGYNLTYQWQENQGSGFADLSNTTLYSGVTTDSLVLATTTVPMNNYTYRCVVHNGCGKTDTTAAATLTVHANPTASITANGPVSFCQNDSVVLQANNAPGYTYQWTFNGSTVSNASGNNYAAYNSGVYAVRVTDANQCSALSLNDTITVNTLPAAVITPAGNTSICQGSSVLLNANTGTGFTYQWQENGSDIPGATTGTYTAANNSSYTVIITNNNSCKNTSAAVAVSVLPFPVATATATGNTTVCQGNNVTINGNNSTGLTYQWLMNGGNISGATNAVYNAGTTGNYSVVIANTAGCSDTSADVAINIIPIQPAVITAAGSLTFCTGDSVKLHVNTITGATYQWQVNSNNISNATDSVYKAITPGNYTVIVTNAANCPAVSSPLTVVVNPLPGSIITYTSPVNFCQDGAVVFTASIPSGLSYQWMMNGSPIPGANSFSYIVSQSGNYSLITTNGFSCTTSSGPVPVTVYPKPQPVITKNNYILSTGSYNSYKWYFNGQPITGAVNQSYTALQNGGYAVEVTDANGCTNRSSLLFINNVGIVPVNQLANEVKIYPNPASDMVHIDAPFRTDIMIRDQLGNLLFDYRNASAADISSVADGIYFISVFDTNHQLITTQKLVKTSR